MYTPYTHLVCLRHCVRTSVCLSPTGSWVLIQKQKSVERPRLVWTFPRGTSNRRPNFQPRRSEVNVIGRQIHPANDAYLESYVFACGLRADRPDTLRWSARCTRGVIHRVPTPPGKSWIFVVENSRTWKHQSFKQFFKTILPSALEVIFNVMRSINPRFTYLLTGKSWKITLLLKSPGS